MQVTIYSKPNCQICDAAKAKLVMMGLEFEVKDIEYMIEPHEGWRSDGSESLLAAYALFNNKIPVICLDDNWFDYPGAMRYLREQRTGGEVGQACLDG